MNHFGVEKGSFCMFCKVTAYAKRWFSHHVAHIIYCKFGNFRENLNFANTLECVASGLQISR